MKPAEQNWEMLEMTGFFEMWRLEISPGSDRAERLYLDFRRVVRREQ
jgi:hypothetical protein